MMPRNRRGCYDVQYRFFDEYQPHITACVREKHLSYHILVLNIV